MNINTSNLSNLQHELEKRVGKQVDLRDAVLKRKDEELKGWIIWSLERKILKEYKYNQEYQTTKLSFQIIFFRNKDKIK